MSVDSFFISRDFTFSRTRELPSSSPSGDDEKNQGDDMQGIARNVFQSIWFIEFKKEQALNARAYHLLEDENPQRKDISWKKVCCYASVMIVFCVGIGYLFALSSGE